MVRHHFYKIFFGARKLKRLVQLEGMGTEQHNTLQQIAAEGSIVADLHMSFTAEHIFDKGNFVSLLYYYGMLTIVSTNMDELVLGIPNNNVRKQYYDYILEESQYDAAINISQLRAAYRTMASKGDIKPALTLIAEANKNTSSVRSSIEGERNFQGFMCAYFSMTSLYIVAPEIEMSHGYCDIFLIPDRKRYPEVAHSYIIKLKYLTAKDTDATGAGKCGDGNVPAPDVCNTLCSLRAPGAVASE